MIRPRAMHDPSPTDLPVVEQEVVACRHLRSAGMCIYSDGQNGKSDNDYDSTSYWCTKSLKNFGPDDEIVGRSECRDPSRSCYEPI